ELQLLRPGVQEGDKTMGVSAQGFIGSELFTQCAGDGLEEQFIGLLLTQPEEMAAQLGGEREGDQKIGRVDELGQFTLDPAVCRLCSTLGAGFVITGVVGKMNMPALAGKDIPAQCRSAAMSDRPDGAMLLR